MSINDLLLVDYQFVNQMNLAKRLIDNYSKKLSTGKNINSAADNPSMMLRLSRLESEIRGSQTAQNNLQDAIAFLDTKDKALEHAQEIGQNLRDLTIKYQNDTLSADDKKAIEEEMTEWMKELQLTLQNTTFNKINVFDIKKLTIQSGPNQNDSITLNMTDTNTPILEDNNVDYPSNSYENNNISNQNTGDGNTNDIDNFNQNASYLNPIENNNSQQTNNSSTSNTTNSSNNSTDNSTSNTLNNGYSTNNSQSSNSQSSCTVTTTTTVVQTPGNSNSNKSLLGKIVDFVDTIFGRNKNNDKGTTTTTTTTVVTTTGGTNNTSTNVSNTNNSNTNNSSTNNSSVLTDWTGTTSNDSIASNTDNSGSESTSNNNNIPTNNQVNNEGQVSENQNNEYEEDNSLTSVLTPDFIDKYILDPITSERTTVGIQRNILESRLEYESKQNVVRTEYYSSIQDVDESKVYMDIVKNQLLYKTNTNLLQESLENRKEYIYNLLY